jgi:hypothetical protein
MLSYLLMMTMVIRVWYMWLIHSHFFNEVEVLFEICII